MQSDTLISNEHIKRTSLQWKKNSFEALQALGLSAAALVTLLLCSGLRIKDAKQPLTEEWSQISVEPWGSTLLGFSFRPRQAQAFGLELRPTMKKLLEYPVQLVRLGAYWNEIEPEKGVFDTSQLDWQIDAVERVGAKIVLCIGALKTFGFPEYFIPQHYMPNPFMTGTLISPTTHFDLLEAASNFIIKIVDRYKNRQAIIIWQLENEPVDPLPFAHYWRISTDFIKRELLILRESDPIRPIMINGGFITSLPLKIGQAWLTRDQGDSVALAKDVSDIIGLDYYPRIAISAIASKSIYLDATKALWERVQQNMLLKWAEYHGKKVMVSEGQAEPWELETIPPLSNHYALYTCTPQSIINNYNTWMCCRKCRSLYAYLFWGAEYWLLRWHQGDKQYLQAFARILEQVQ